MGAGCGSDFAVEFRDFSFTYEGSRRPALRGVNLRLRSGQMHLVVGASGSGKTTLLRSVVGLVPHLYGGEVRGDVVVCGTSVPSSSIREVASRVGYVFQDPEDQLLASTIGRDVSASLESRGVPPGEAEGLARRILEELGAGDLYDRPAHALSDGQKQRAAIAEEIARGPSVLLLDEPSSMLDPEGAEGLMDLLARLKGDGLTIVVVEHRLGPALPRADNLIALSDGSVLMSGPPRELLASWDSVSRLRAAGVSVPPVVEVYHGLRFKGLELGRVPLTADELLAMLRGRVNRI